MDLRNYVKEEFPTRFGGVYIVGSGNIQPFLHWHPHYEVLLIREGDYELESNTLKYSSHRPAVFVHRPFCLHALNADTTKIYSRYIIHMDRKVLSEIPENILDIGLFAESSVLRADPDPDEMEVLARICENIIKAEMKSDYVEGALYSGLLFHEISKVYKSGRGEAYVTRHSYIQDVLQYITDNLAEPVTIDTLCVRFGVGHTKLLDDFRTATGSTYKKYLTDLRQTRARELMETGSSIINASLETGYSSEAHFIKAFREYWGMTPGEFRSSLKN